MSTRADAQPSAPPKGVTPPSAPGGRPGFLSDVIVELGFATRETVEQAVRAARSPGTTVARVLVDSGAIDEEQLAHATAERYGIAYIDLETFTVEPGAANLIKPSAAKRYQAVPVGFVGGGLLIAMADPADALGVNDIAVMTKMDVKPGVASRPALGSLLEALPLPEEDAGDEQGAGPDPAADYAATSRRGASTAVFWQAGEDGGEGTRETLPEDAAPAEPPSTDAGGGDEDAARLRAELEKLRERLTATEAELDQAGARARDAESAAAETEQLREKLTTVEKDLKRARAEVDVRSEEMDGMRERLTAADTELARARTEADEWHQARARLERRIEELEDADRRAEHARQALAQMREESEREREQLAVGERDARAQLEESENRRGALEERLAEVESSAFASERAFEELRESQRRMRAALRSLAEPDAPDGADGLADG